MDIRNWPLDKIMQLPDHCFGRRWPVLFSQGLSAPGTKYFISEMGLPDRCVLWELCCSVVSEVVGVPYECVPFSLALGDNLPVGFNQFWEFENMFPEADEISQRMKLFRGNLYLTQLRKPYAAQGRRVVLRVEEVASASWPFSLGLVFSSIPKEVPDCLLSV